MALSPRLLARLRLVLTALLFSTGGMAVKSCDLGSWQVASFRCGVAALTLLLVLPASRALLTRRTGSRGAWLVGLAYAATMLLYVLANKSTTAANAIFLQSTAPIYILLLGPLLLGEQNQRRDLFFLVAMAGGMGLFFLGQPEASESAPAPFLGNALATVAGLAWALTVVGLRWLAGRSSEAGEGSSSAGAVLAGNLLAFGIALPLALPVGAASGSDWLWIFYLGAVQIALAYVLMTSALRHLSALETSLILLLEPVLNPLWAWLSHGEILSRWAMLGAALILLATGIKTWWDSRGTSGVAGSS